MSNKGTSSGKGMRFVSNDGNTNFSVSNGKMSKLDLEVIDSKFSNKEQNIDRRDEHLNDVMSELENSGEAGAAGGNLFAKPKSNAPDPDALLAFIDQTNANDTAAEEAKHPKLNFNRDSEGGGTVELEVNTDVDAAEVIQHDDYLSELIGSHISNEESGGDASTSAEAALGGMVQGDSSDGKDHLTEMMEDAAQKMQQAQELADSEVRESKEQAHAETRKAHKYTEAKVQELQAENQEKLSALNAEKDAQSERITELQTKVTELEKAMEDAAAAHAEAIAKLQADAEQEADEAYQKGVEEGVANSQAEIEEHKNKVIQISEGIPASLNNYLEELEEQMKEEVCTFSLSIAENFIRKEIADSEVFKETIKSALSPIMNYKGVTLFLNPEVAEHASKEFNLPTALKVEADPQLEPGEALVETDMGYIDATLARRLEELKESFNKPASLEG